MATQQVEDIGTGADRAKVALAIVLAVGGVIAVVSIWIVVALAARKAVQGEPDLKPETAVQPAPNETVAKN